MTVAERREKRRILSVIHQATQLGKRTTRQNARQFTPKVSTPSLKRRADYLDSTITDLASRLQTARRATTPRRTTAFDPAAVLSQTSTRREVKLPQLKRRLAKHETELSKVQAELNRRKSARFARHEPSTLEALEIASLGIPGVGLVTGGAKLLGAKAISEIGARLAGRGALDASVSAAIHGGGKIAAEQAARGSGRVGAAIAKGTARAPRTAKALRTTGKIAKGTGKGAGKAAAFPITHPVRTGTATLAAEVGPAIASGDTGKFSDALKGQGTLGTMLNTAGGAVTDVIPGVAGNALSDAIELPASVVPSLYMLGAGGVEAAQGDSSRLDEMWKSYKETDFLPALLSGDPGEALKRAGEHPLYAALEASGLRAAAGGLAGRVVRTPKGEERPPYYVQGGEKAGEGAMAPLRGSLSKVRGTYSRDPLVRAVQKSRDAKMRDKRPGPMVEDARGQAIGSIQATERQAAASVKKAALTEFATNRALQVGERDQIAAVMEKVKPPRHSAPVVQLMAQRILRSPETAIADLTKFHQQLLDARPTLNSRAKLDANARSIATVKAAIENPDVEGIARATTEFLKEQAPREREMISRGLIAEEQASRASRFAFARTHMDAQHGKPPEVMDRIRELESHRVQEGGRGLTREEVSQLQTLRAIPGRLQTAKGKPLSTAEIDAEMARQGVPVEEGVGYVSGRPGGADKPGSFYRGYNERPQLAGKALSGEAAQKGLAEMSWENLVGSVQHQASVTGAAKFFDHWGQRFGLGIKDKSGKAQPFDSPATARAAIESPADFNVELPPLEGGYTLFQIGGMTSKASELEAARRFGPKGGAETPHPHPEMGNEQLMEGAVARSLAAADPKGKTFIIPVGAAELMREAFAPRAEFWKAGEAATGWLKKAWLPTHPSWLLGNVVDNYLVRALGTGLGPGEIRTGGRLAKLVKQELPPDEAARALETMAPGAIFGTVARQARHMPAEFRNSPMLKDVTRAAGALARTPGIKTALSAFDKYTRAIFKVESRYVERVPQFGELSRASRKMLGQTRGQWRRAVKAQDPAVMDFVRHGLRDTNYQQFFAEEVAKTFGNWTRMTPSQRKYLSTIAPFWTWARAASRFVFLTMPVEHPAITGIMAAAGQMTREDRDLFGLDPNAEIPLPGFLQGSLPLGVGTAKVSNLTSYGFFADPGNAFASMVGPQVSGALQNLQGLDWTGRQLTQEDGRPATTQQRALAAGLTFAEAFLPFSDQVQAVAKHGPTGLSPVKVYDKGYTDYLRNRQNQQQISVPIKGVPQLEDPAEESSSSIMPSTPPWRSSPSTSTSSATPWR